MKIVNFNLYIETYVLSRQRGWWPRWIGRETSMKHQEEKCVEHGQARANKSSKLETVMPRVRIKRVPGQQLGNLCLSEA